MGLGFCAPDPCLWAGNTAVNRSSRCRQRDRKDTYRPEIPQGDLRLQSGLHESRQSTLCARANKARNLSASWEGHSLLTYHPVAQQPFPAALLLSVTPGSRLLMSRVLPFYTVGHLVHRGRGIASVDSPTRGSVARSRCGVCHVCPQPTGPNPNCKEG